MWIIIFLKIYKKLENEKCLILLNLKEKKRKGTYFLYVPLNNYLLFFKLSFATVVKSLSLFV